MFNADFLSETFSAGIQVPIRLEWTDKRCSHSRLTVQEKKSFAAFEHSNRKTSWLKGREALKRLLRKMKEDADTSTIFFPNRRFSLTHSGKYAVAAGSKREMNGLGIDYQSSGFFSDASARFFLTPDEIKYTQSLSSGRRKKQLLRMWTVKEALFKAHLLNHNTWLGDYILRNPDEISGEAYCGKQFFLYSSLKLQTGYLTIARAIGD